MKKLIVMMMLLLPIAALAQNSLMGISFGIPVAEFEAQIQSKTEELAGVAKAKKCKVSVNKNLPGEIQTACFVQIELEYKPTEVEMGYAVIRSILNSKYGDNKAGETMSPLHTNGLFWKTPFGEVVVYQITNTIKIRIFDYASLETSYSELFKAL